MATSQTPYQILGVAKTATQDEIKNAYRTLAKKLHPDLNPGNKEAERKFKDIANAYELIGTEDARKKYDLGEAEQAQQRSYGGGGPQGRARNPYYYETQQDGGRYSSQFEGSFGQEDIFESIFGQGRGRRAQPQDETYQMEIDFRDAVLGAEKEIILGSQKKLRVKIPAGVETGKKLRFSGQASSGGDAYVEIHVKPSERFKRVGNNIEIEWPIGLASAVLGGEIEVPTVDGMVKVTVPSGVSSGAKLRVKGKGVPQDGARGDEIVILSIKLPKEIDPEVKEAIRKWSEKGAAHVS
jgi:DnaJ-class molecular chaperone